MPEKQQKISNVRLIALYLARQMPHQPKNLWGRTMRSGNSETNHKTRKKRCCQMSSLKTINCRHGKMCSSSSSAGLVNWQYLALIVLTGQLLLDCSSTADPSYDKPSPISIYYTLVGIYCVPNWQSTYRMSTRHQHVQHVPSCTLKLYFFKTLIMQLVLSKYYFYCVLADFSPQFEHLVEHWQYTTTIEPGF